MPKLSNNESQDFTHYLRFNYVDLQTTGYLSTIGAANQRVIGSVPAGGAVSVCAVYEKTGAGTANDITIDVGVTAADPDDFIDALNLYGLTKAAYNTGDVLTTSGDDGTLYVNNSTSAVDIVMEVNGTHASLTAGDWLVCWKQFDPGRFAA